MRLLLVEDNERFATLLKQGLANAGFAVDVMTMARDAMAALETGRWDAGRGSIAVCPTRTGLTC